MYNERRLREKPIPITQAERHTKKSSSKKPIHKRQPSKPKSPSLSVVDTPPNSPSFSSVGTPSNSPTPIDENDATTLDLNLSLHLNHENEDDAASLNDAADEVIYLSDSANIGRHR